MMQKKFFSEDKKEKISRLIAETFLDENGETWKKIQSSPDHKISKNAVIKNFKTGKILTPSKNSKGYFIVKIAKKSRTIHRILALAFIPNPHNHEIIDHIDRNKLNNKLTNLRWTTVSENNKNKINKVAKNITQYSLDGILIKRWKSAEEIVDVCKKYTKSNLGIAARNKTKYNNFYWLYDEKDMIIKHDTSELIKFGKLKGFDYSNYGFSKDGTKIISLVSRKETKLFMSNNYIHVRLCSTEGKKTIFPFHTLVNVFLNGVEYDENMVIDHINGNKLDNSQSNLEAVTKKENVVRAIGKAIKQIDPENKKIVNIFRTMTDAANTMKLYLSGLYVCAKSDDKVFGGFLWKYSSKEEYENWIKSS